MTPNTKYKFEQQISVVPIPSKPDHFLSVYPAWGYPGLKRIAGSIPLTEASVAAQKTVPKGFLIHNLQAQFCRPGIWGDKITHVVTRQSTSSKFAVRTVQCIQQDQVRAVFSFSFFKSDLDSQPPMPFDWIPQPRGEVPALARRKIDPELDDFNNPKILNVPDGTQYPAFESERIPVTTDAGVGERIYRGKFRVTSEVSSAEGQIAAVIYMSDFYAVDGPLNVFGLDFGIPAVGDRSKKPRPQSLEQFATINHSMHFVRLSGWDVNEGLLSEIKLRWAKGRRAVVSITIRDVRGEAIATSEQEGYYVFMRGKGSYGPGSMSEDERKKAAERNKSKI